MSETWAYFNGEWVPSSDLRIGVDDVGFMLGVTITERLRTFRGEVFRLDEHLCRLRRSLEIIDLDVDGIAAQVASAVPEFVERNRALLAEDDDWSITAFVTPGVSGATRPTVCVHGFPLLFDKWASQYESGLSVVVSRVRQVPPDCWPPELKCRSRMHYYLADHAAAIEQPGARILLDEHGYVAEATTANVVVYRANEGLISPPHGHILPGVSLGVVRELAGSIGVPFVSRAFTPDELRTADEVMLASTSICLLPIVECDRQKIGRGQPGPVYRQLLAAWSRLVGVDVAEQARRCASRR